MGMHFSCNSSGYSLFFSNVRDYNYYIIDNRMKEDIKNNIQNLVKNAFERYNSTK